MKAFYLTIFLISTIGYCAGNAIKNDTVTNSTKLTTTETHPDGKTITTIAPVTVSMDINGENITDPAITEIDAETTTVLPTTMSTKTTSTTTKTTTPSTTISTSTTSKSTTTTPTTSSSTTSTTSAPTKGTTTAAPKPTPTDRKFDGPSFVGGIVLALGLVAIGFVAFKFYKARTELNYHTL